MLGPLLCFCFLNVLPFFSFSSLHAGPRWSEWAPLSSGWALRSVPPQNPPLSALQDTALALWFPSVLLAAAEAVLAGRCSLAALVLQGIGPCARGYSKDQVRPNHTQASLSDLPLLLALPTGLRAPCPTSALPAPPASAFLCSPPPLFFQMARPGMVKERQLLVGLTETCA